jgi:hypothetical protein
MKLKPIQNSFFKAGDVIMRTGQYINYTMLLEEVIKYIEKAKMEVSFLYVTFNLDRPVRFRWYVQAKKSSESWQKQLMMSSLLWFR